MTEHQPPPAETETDPALDRVRRKLVRFMAINLGFLFLALMAVVIAIVYRTWWQAPEVAEAPVTELQAPPPGSMLSGEIELPAGARLVSHTLSGNRLTFDVEIDGGREIFVYDIAEGRMIGRFAVLGTR